MSACELNFTLGPFLEWCGNVAPSVEDAAFREAKKQLIEVQRVMRTKRAHRYHSHTGKLNQSMTVQMTDYGGRVFLDPDMPGLKGTDPAEYGVYVHEGHGTWEPDRFTTKALEIQHDEIIRGLSEAVTEAIQYRAATMGALGELFGESSEE